MTIQTFVLGDWNHIFSGLRNLERYLT